MRGTTKGRKESCPPNHTSGSRALTLLGKAGGGTGRAVQGHGGAESGSEDPPSTHEGKVWEALVLLISSCGRDVCLDPFYRWEN